MLALFGLCYLLFKFLDYPVLPESDLDLLLNFCLLHLYLSLEDQSEFVGERSSEVKAFTVNQIGESHVRVKHCFEQNSAFDTLHRNLPSNLFNRDVVHQLNEMKRVRCVDLIFRCLKAHK